MKKKKNKYHKNYTKGIKKISILFLAVVTYLSVMTENAFAENKINLFYIENSLILTKAVYAIKLNDNNQIENNEPIFNYWLRPNGDTRDMTWIENYIAYGISYQKIKDTYTVEFALHKYPEIKIIAQIQNNKPVTYFVLQNKKYILEKLYAKAYEGIFVPNVQYVEIIGYDIKSKQKVVKRIREKKDDNEY